MIVKDLSCSINLEVLTAELTWHNGVIPVNEIWVKTGGDKGGSSFKTSIEVLCFVVFEAPDCSSNLHIALNRYDDQIDHLQDSCWRYIKEVTLSEYLCQVITAAYGVLHHRTN
uniref:Uncharacterized protein n=1 Tax=Amphimedon queenslandica TaxID=400682 RepID=A0A1X7VFL6_AMPQE